MLNQEIVSTVRGWPEPVDRLNIFESRTGLKRTSGDLPRHRDFRLFDSSSSLCGMKSGTILKTGLAGSALAGICCFTPVLVLLLGALGMTAALAWLDFVVLPALALFLGITGYALWRMKRERSS